MKLTAKKLKELIAEELKNIDEGSYFTDESSPILDDIKMMIDGQGGQATISYIMGLDNENEDIMTAIISNPNMFTIGVAAEAGSGMPMESKKRKRDK